MNIENKVKNIIDILEDAIAFEDWGRVEDAQKELTFLFEEIQSTLPMDDWDDEELYKWSSYLAEEECHPLMFDIEVNDPELLPKDD